MRILTRALAIGCFAAVGAAVTFAVKPSLTDAWRVRHSDAAIRVHAWSPKLRDPIFAAKEALRRGDSSYVAVKVDGSIRFPGLEVASRDRPVLESFRMYSSASTGLRGAQWSTFASSATLYASVYNSTIRAMRADSLSGP